jgi:uncharacterized membrane protein YgcG
MRFDPDYRPFVAPKCIYIIPLSGDPTHYQVLIPIRLTKKLLDLLIQDKLEIHRFEGCPEEAVDIIKAQLGRSCAQGPSRYSIRMNQVLVAGTVLVVLGIINITLPDPLPLADEILMIGGGAGIGMVGYRNRRRVLPLLRDKTDRAVKQLEGLECHNDVLLTRIHEAIRARSAPTPDLSTKEPVDAFELESRWLVEYLDLQKLIDSKAITFQHLDSLLEVLSDALPLSRFLSLEQKLRKNPKDGSARRARERMAERYGLSPDAFTVYVEFYRLAREILSAGSTGGKRGGGGYGGGSGDGRSGGGDSV